MQPCNLRDLTIIVISTYYGMYYDKHHYSKNGGATRHYDEEDKTPFADIGER